MGIYVQMMIKQRIGGTHMGGNTNWRNVSKATYVDSLYHPYKIVKLIGGMVYDCFSNIIGDRNPQYC